MRQLALFGPVEGDQLEDSMTQPVLHSARFVAGCIECVEADRIQLGACDVRRPACGRAR